MAVVRRVEASAGRAGGGGGGAAGAGAAGAAAASAPASFRPVPGAPPALRFRGVGHFRQRVCFAVLSGRAIRIDDIHPAPPPPQRRGLRACEESFLRLIERLTTGTAVRISASGTRVEMRPGFLAPVRPAAGEDVLVHECGDRAVGYFAEGILWLAPFAKAPVAIAFRGITNPSAEGSDDDAGDALSEEAAAADPSPDMLRTVAIPLLHEFGVEAELTLVRRGAAPAGGGEVLLRVEPVRGSLRPIALADPAATIRRIRGIAYSVRVPQSHAVQAIAGAREVLRTHIGGEHLDVFVYTDHARARDSGPSPGYGLLLVAEGTRAGMRIAAEGAGRAGEPPAELGRCTALRLLAQVREGGAVDSRQQPSVLLYMSLADAVLSRVALGRLTPFAVETLRLIRDFFGVRFRLGTATPEAGDERGGGAAIVVATCRGAGFRNVARKIS